jgi:5-methylcytosine-specific restriction endonuclease McrA
MDVEKEVFIRVCNESLTMSIAAEKLKIPFNTFKRKAMELGCYKQNQGGKGTKKTGLRPNKIDLQEILEGKHPSFQTFKLKNKLIKAGLLENKCSVCEITEWNGSVINCELDHINGNRHDHRLQNLRMLCPNCHSQTSTYCAKNKGKY